MERTDSDWGQASEPVPRWRQLLDRSRLHGRLLEEHRPVGRQYPEDGSDLADERYPPGWRNGRPDERLPTRADVPPETGARSWLPPQPEPHAHPRPEPHARPRPEPPADPGARTWPRPEPPADPGARSRPRQVDPGADRYRDPRQDPYRETREVYREPYRDPYREPYPGQGGHRDPRQPLPEPRPLFEPRPGPESRPAPEPRPVAARWRQAEPDPGERFAERLRRDLGGPRVLAFANPKGGVHKTTATVLTAATVGVVRRRGVLAWDDNELRGTLGLRAGSARHARTIRHLVRDLMAVEAASGYELTERLDEYLRHAADGSYDVLAGEESPRFAQRLDPHTVRRLLELLRRTHDVVCVDTGNNVESPNWQTVIQAADQLVVTTVPREDAAFTADWMLDLLHEMGLGEVADSAVTLISCPTPKPSPLLSDLAAHFATRTRAVVVVPYDPALEAGSSIDHTALQPATRRAWLEAAAAMLDAFPAEGHRAG